MSHRNVLNTWQDRNETAVTAFWYPEIQLSSLLSWTSLEFISAGIQNSFIHLPLKCWKLLMWNSSFEKWLCWTFLRFSTQRKEESLLLHWGEISILLFDSSRNAIKPLIPWNFPSKKLMEVALIGQGLPFTI